MRWKNIGVKNVKAIISIIVELELNIKSLIQI